MSSHFTRRHSPLRALVIAIVVVLGLSWLSSLPVAANMAWYEGLQKPWFNPPSWSFGVVWPLLYVMMTVAAWIVAQPHKRRKATRLPQTLFAVQLACNLLWTPIFFGLQSPWFGLCWIGVVWVAVAATLLCFWRIDRRAGMLLVPYLAWVSFAAVLTHQIWVLN